MVPAPAHSAADAFTAFFFGTADEVVQQYVHQLLEGSIEDGASCVELAEDLSSFLPGGCSVHDLEASLAQLDSVMQQPEEHHSYAWLQPPPSQQVPHEQVHAEASAEEATQALAAGAAGEQQLPAHASQRSGLNIGAAEFKPGPAASPPSLEKSLNALQLGSEDGPSASSRWRGRAEAGRQGQQIAPSDWQGYPAHTAGSDLQAQHAAAPLGDWAAAAAAAEARVAAGGRLSEDALLAVLADQFPLWSEDALRQLFDEQGGDVAALVSTLCSLESELEGQQLGVVADSEVPGAAAEVPLALTEDEFPSLGNTNSGTSPAAVTGRTPAASGYASRAAAAAALPVTPKPARRQPPAASAAAARTADAGPAPIWQQEEGVARFATGHAVAAEYAALRADARDHARLRNACFEQATQAYMAGNRRLARELGAKGRWHNEQMHAAHAAAAAQLYERRNVGAGASVSGRSSASVRTVDLHGLHVSEALDRVDALLAELGAARGAAGSRRLRLVVGEGKHGQVPARLPACVRRYLDSLNVPYSEPYAGLLEVRV